MSSKRVYLVLGSRGGGRADVLQDLVDFGLPAESETRVFVSEDDVSHWDGTLSIRHEQCRQSQYIWQGMESGLAINATEENLLIVTDGLADPADFVEAFFDWVSEFEYELGRIITVVDCTCIHENSQMAQWYDCCIHFSDVVLLNNRQGLSNKWIDKFKGRYLKEYYPCLFEYVKKGRLSNPSLILEPQARRISKLFDDVDEFEFHFESDEDEDEEEENVAGDPSKDPFLAKLVNGRRQRPLPIARKLIG